MSTIFDFLAVAAFSVMAGFYIFWRFGDQKLLMQLLVAALAFALANQLGNHGLELFGTIVLLAGASYAALCFGNRWRP